MIEHNARVAIKRHAWETLNQEHHYRDMLAANFFPWLLGIMLRLYFYQQVITLAINFGFERALEAPADFQAYVTSNSHLAYFNLFEGLVLLWFVTGIKYTALELVRGKRTKVQPVETLLRTFNADYFFPVLFTWMIYAFFIEAGLTLLVVPAIIWGCAYSQSFYILYSGREAGRRIGPLSSIALSGRLMLGNKMSYFRFELSLLGWTLLNIVTLGIAGLFTAPYLQLTRAGYYQLLTAQKALDNLN